VKIAKTSAALGGCHGDSCTCPLLHRRCRPGDNSRWVSAGGTGGHRDPSRREREVELELNGWTARGENEGVAVNGAFLNPSFHQKALGGSTDPVVQSPCPLRTNNTDMVNEQT